MTLFDRDGKGIKPAAFAPRPASRRPRTSWLAPPMAKRESVRPPPSAPVPDFGLDEGLPDDLQFNDGALAQDLSGGYGQSAPPRFHDEVPDQSGTFMAEQSFGVDANRAGGQAAGVIANDGRVLGMLQELGESIAALGGLQEEILAQCETHIVDLAIAIAKRVVAQELHTDRMTVVSLAREGIKALGSQSGAVVRVGEGFSPAELGEIQQRLADLKCELLVDIALPPGRCVVEVDHGRVEESVDERLRAVLHSIEETRGGQS